ncbi:hypothetical protein Hanom_Chr01g00051751 [Helianthus anomalus]
MFIDICFWFIELLLFCLDFGNATHPNAPLIRRSTEPDTDEVFAQITLIAVSDQDVTASKDSAPPSEL